MDLIPDFDETLHETSPCECWLKIYVKINMFACVGTPGKNSKFPGLINLFMEMCIVLILMINNYE